MDPKKTAQLDPKLKEAYDRVMGTVTSQVPSPQVAKPPPPPASEPLSQNPSMPPAPPPSSLQPKRADSPPVKVGTTFVAIPNKNNPPAGGSKTSVFGVLLIILILIFILGYAFFWIKFFNVSLPFLPQ